MQLSYYSNYEELSKRAARVVLEEIRVQPGMLLCAATGSSPSGLYAALAAEAQIRPELFRQLRILKLDEWGGIPDHIPGSCEQYLRSRVLLPLQIPEDRYFSFSSNPPDPRAECERIRSILHREGPIDLCILGLGKNGHLGLNEPAEMLEPCCHVVHLSPESLQHSMLAEMEIKPSYGLSLGMQEILSARKILMLISGKGKAQVAKAFLDGKISTRLPASFLWAHPHVECLIDEAAL